MAAVEAQQETMDPKTTLDKPYLLNVDDNASKRLNVQNEIFLGLFEGKFIPDQVVTHLKHMQESKGSASIADLATGTGIWLYTIRSQLSEESINADLYGYDLFDKQFPPEDMRRGVSFQAADILDSKVAESIGPKFDYIHMRLLTAVLKVDEWPIAIDNALKMLNPGGYIHCVEIPIGETSNEEKNGSKDATTVWNRVKTVLTHTNKDLFCARNIFKIFQSKDLEDIDHTIFDIRDYDEETRKIHNLNAYYTIEEFVRTGVARGPPVLQAFGYDSEDAAWAELKEAERDYKERGTLAVFGVHSILGRKP